MKATKAGPFLLVTALACTPPQSARASALRTSPQDLLDLLEPHEPDAARILGIRAKQGEQPALKALAEHFRHRENLGWPVPDPQDFRCPPDPEADSALHGTHRAIGMWFHSAQGNLQWHEDPTGKNGHPPDVEWLFGVNRHQWWPTLACRVGKGDATEASRTLVREIHSWIQQCPVPASKSNTKVSTWRTIEAGIRMLNAWPLTFERMRRSPEVPDSILLEMAASMVEHADYLAKYKTDHNWLTMEMNGLHAVGSYFPEFSRSASWRQTALRTMDSSMRDQLLPDGVQEELSPSYHSLTLWCTRDLFLRCQATHRTDELPPRFIATLEKGYDVLATLWAPDGDHPRLNDSHDISIPDILAQGVELFPQHEDWRWIATRRKSGSPPKYTSRLFPWAGWCLFRTSWNPDANLVVFDRGAPGKGHEHQDKLAICAWSHGRQILFDDGGGPYEDSPFRKYSLSTHGHSTVLVDGMGQNRAANRPSAPDSGRWSADPLHAWASGTYDEGWGDSRLPLATHTRTVLFHPDLWIVSDLVRTRDQRPHSAQARWQILSTSLRCDSTICATHDPNLPNLVLVPLDPSGPSVAHASGQTEPELLGWYVGLDKRTPATTLLHTYPSGTESRFATLLIPTLPGEDARLKTFARTPQGTRVEMSDGRGWILNESATDPSGWDVKKLDTKVRPGT